MTDAVLDDKEIIDEFVSPDGDKVTLSPKKLPREYFHDNREAEDARKEKSREIHDSMTPERQAHLKARLRKGMLWMADHVDDWAPLSLSWNSEEGEAVAVEFVFAASDLEDGEQLDAQATKVELEDALASLRGGGTASGKDEEEAVPAE